MTRREFLNEIRNNPSLLIKKTTMTQNQVNKTLKKYGYHKNAIQLVPSNPIYVNPDNPLTFDAVKKYISQNEIDECNNIDELETLIKYKVSLPI